MVLTQISLKEALIRDNNLLLKKIFRYDHWYSNYLSKNNLHIKYIKNYNNRLSMYLTLLDLFLNTN